MAEKIAGADRRLTVSACSVGPLGERRLLVLSSVRLAVAPAMPPPPSLLLLGISSVVPRTRGRSLKNWNNFSSGYRCGWQKEAAPLPYPFVAPPKHEQRWVWGHHESITKSAFEIPSRQRLHGGRLLLLVMCTGFNVGVDPLFGCRAFLSVQGDGEVDPARAYSHVGCYADSKPDRVLGHLMKSPEMSSEVSRTGSRRFTPCTHELLSWLPRVSWVVLATEISCIAT